MAPVPMIIYTVVVYKGDYSALAISPNTFSSLDDKETMSKVWHSKNYSWNALMFYSPLVLVNFMHVVVVNGGFYILGLLQKSFWLFDPYFSIWPVVYGLIWLLHPLASLTARSYIALLLIILWGVRLTHNQMRREKFKFGTREDWRYTLMAMACGSPLWYFVAIPYVFIS